MNPTERILSLIERRTGMDIATLGGLPVIRKAMEQCREAAGSASMESWIESLLYTPENWQAFLQQIIVPETFFFRYPESFQALTKWIANYPKRPLKVLCLPCSTGEEAYSIAITFQRAGLRSSDYSIRGYDINLPSVTLARAGVFHRSSSFRGIEPPVHEKFFEPRRDGFAVAEHLKENIDFRQGNFWEVSSLEERYDIIFCRNLLIYFPHPRQVEALEKLAALLDPKGMLFLGPAEVPLASQRGWKAAGYPMSFACVREKAAAPVTFKPQAIQPLPKPTLIPKPASFAARAAAPTLPPAPAFPDLPKIRELADRGAVAEARKALDHYHRLTPPDAESYLLDGLLAEAQGNRSQAESLFRKALYLSPSHPEAISHLAWLLQADGRLEASRRLLARADRVKTP